MENGYHIYMRRFGTDSDETQPVIDLEADFPGLRYKESKGLSAKGAPKNIYVEEYADSDRARVFIPEEVCREATEITLTLLFVGEDRRKVFDDFYDYVKNGKFYYWDDVRKRKAAVVLNSAVEPSDDIFKGSDVYIQADFTFQNLYGQTFRLCEEL